LTAKTELRDRVWAAPETVSFGPLAIGLIREQPDLIRRMRRTLQICHAGGSDFQVELRADLPALDLRWERSPEGTCYQATIRLVPENLQVGLLHGFVYVETNDRESPRLRVPVTGTILDR